MCADLLKAEFLRSAFSGKALSLNCTSIVARDFKNLGCWTSGSSENFLNFYLLFEIDNIER